MAATATMSAAVSAADGFDPNLNGNVYAVTVQPDGKVLVGGNFTSVKPNGATTVTNRQSLARFNPDGTLDGTFNASVEGQVNAIALQADGAIVIGGKFTKVGGATRNNAARLKADGSLDSAFDPNAAGSLVPDVRAVLVQANGQIVIGGAFYTVKGLANADSPHYLARFNADGSLDTSFKPNPNGSVLALAEQADGRILLGGAFTTVQPVGADKLTRNHIARITSAGKLDSFDPNADSTVYTIVLDEDGRILIGGAFSTLTPNGSSTAYSRAYTARLTSSGAVDTTFAPSPNSAVFALAIERGGYVVLGGGFGVTRFDAAGSYTPRVPVQPNGEVRALAPQADGGIIVGGSFNAVGLKSGQAVTRNRVFRLMPSGDLDATFNPIDNGRPYAVAVQADGKILIGGSFANIGGVNHRSIARLNANGTLDATFNADTDGRVQVIKELSDHSILIGGTFSYVNNKPASYLVKLKPDGTTDTSFNMRPNAPVLAILEQSDGKIVVGGQFTTMKLPSDETTTTRNYLARINADGTLDANFNPMANGAVYALQLAKDGSSIYAGGAFTQLVPNNKDPFARYSLVRLHADGTVDKDFLVSTNANVNDLALASDGSLVFAGSFTFVASPVDTYPRFRIAKVSDAGVVDTTFDPAANAAISHVLATGDQFLLVGRFTNLAPNGGASATRNYIARINADGTLDPAFDVRVDNQAGNEVTAVATQASDQSIIFAGTFNTVQPGGAASPVARNRLVRVTSAGALDTTLNVDITGQASPVIRSIGVDVDGSVLVTGSFSDYNGAIGASVARFYADSSPDLSFSANVTGQVNAFATLPSTGSVATQMQGFAAFTPTAVLDESFSPSAADQISGAVYTMALDASGRLLLGGSFTYPSDRSTIVYLARYSRTGVRDTTFKPVFNGLVTCMAVQSDGRILVGGSFTTVNGNTQKYFARLNADGTLDTSLLTTVDGGVYSIKLADNDHILIGGAFTTLQDQKDSLDYVTRYHIARLATADGKVDKDFDPSADNAVRAIAVQSDGKILVGGDFTAFKPNGASTATSRSKLARLNTDGTLDDSFKPNPDGTVYSIVLQSDGAMVIGGAFQNVGIFPHGYIARITAAGDLDGTFKTIANSVVDAIVPEGDKYLIGGSFSYLAYAGDATNFIARGYVARVNKSDGTVDESFAPDLNQSVVALAIGSNPEVIYAGGLITSVQSTAAYIIGGQFTRVNGSPAANLALISSHGSLNGSFTPNPDGAVNVVQAQPDGRLLVAGNFKKIAGQTRTRVAFFRADQTLDPAMGDLAVNGEVKVAATQPDGSVIIGGAFTSVGGASHRYLARIGATGAVDSAFNPSISGPVAALAVQADGAILYSAGTGAAAEFKRLLSDGTPDGSFTPVVTGMIDTIAVESDGYILVGGPFTCTSGGKTFNYLARLTSTGALDASYRPAPDQAVTAATLQSDGKLLVGGSFTQIGGKPRFGLARLSAVAAASDTFTLASDRSTVEWALGGSAGLLNSVLVEKSSDEATWTELGMASRVGSTNMWRLTGFSVPSRVTVFFRFRGTAPAGSGTSTGFYERVYSRYPAPTPVLANPDVPPASEGSVFHYTLRASDDPTKFTATGLPPGLTLDAASGLISGTPTTAGTYTVTITVRNASYSTTATVTMVVNPPSAPDQPVALAASQIDADAFTANWSPAATATGYKLDVATDSAFAQLLATYTVSDGETSSRRVTGLTPLTTYYYRVRAYNTIGTSANSSSIQVKTLKTKAPKITSASSTTFTATLVSQFTFTATGAPAPTFSATGLPSWAKLDAATGVLRGTAPATAVGAIIPVTVTAQNGVSPSSSQSFTLNVADVPAITTPLLLMNFAGKLNTPGSADGTGSAARFRLPMGLAINLNDTIFVSDTGNHAIRQITTDAIVTTLAGHAGTAGTSNGTGDIARFNMPSGVTVGTAGILYVADTLNNTIRKITAGGVVTTIAGEPGVSGSADGTGSAAHFFAPQAVALNNDQKLLYVADTNNHTIRQIDLSTFTVTTLAGYAGVSGSTDGQGDAARFNAPSALAVGSDGTIYVADTDNNTIRTVTIEGKVATLAGQAGAIGAADGTGKAARFNHPAALAVGSGNVLYILDTDNQTVRQMSSSGGVTTLAGLAGKVGSANGLGSAARFNYPVGIAVNSDGELFIADTNYHRIRKAVFPAVPTITTQPLDRSVRTGDDVTLTVVATGEPTPKYQWKFNGTDLAEATNITGTTTATLTLTDIQPASAGKYTVVVSNDSGSVTSNEATVTVDNSASSSGGGGGGGGPSWWFYASLFALAGARALRSRGQRRTA